MKFTNEDIEKIERFIEIKNRGFYVDGAQLTEVYNRVLEKHVNVTNCGSCLRQRVNELEVALNSFKAKMAKDEENKALESPTPQEDMKARMEKVRSHRKINKQ